MRSKINTARVRNDLCKKATYKKRNWPKYMEKIAPKNVEAPVLEQPIEKVKPNVPKNNLERVPEKDVLDFSGEESGYFKIGNNIVDIIFPR